jgi:hypothetical protein
MPEESLNLYISNIYAIVIFTIVVIFIFIMLFLLSRFFIYSINNKTFSEKGYQVRKAELYKVKKDINLSKNIFIFGIVFIFITFFILLILLTLNFASNFKLGDSLYLLVGIIFLLIALSVYLAKSEVFK